MPADYSHRKKACARARAQTNTGPTGPTPVKTAPKTAGDVGTPPTAGDSDGDSDTDSVTAVPPRVAPKKRNSSWRDTRDTTPSLRRSLRLRRDDDDDDGLPACPPAPTKPAVTARAATADRTASALSPEQPSEWLRVEGDYVEPVDSDDDDDDDGNDDDDDDGNDDDDDDGNDDDDDGDGDGDGETVDEKWERFCEGWKRGHFAC